MQGILPGGCVIPPSPQVREHQRVMEAISELPGVVNCKDTKGDSILIEARDPHAKEMLEKMLEKKIEGRAVHVRSLSMNIRYEPVTTEDYEQALKALPGVEYASYIPRSADSGVFDLLVANDEDKKFVDGIVANSIPGVPQWNSRGAAVIFELDHPIQLADPSSPIQ